jgi:hypothetical protein
MNYFRQGKGWLSSFAAVVLLISTADAQNTTNFLHPKPSPVPAALIPPPSPIVYFRNLLAMTPNQRQIALANKSPQVRQRILIKVTEYAALDPRQCELRLRATELRWFLMPVLRASPDTRNAQLARVPQNLRDMVNSRLQQWEILPPSIQQEFLDNEQTLSYFSQVNVTNDIAGSAGPSNSEKSRWNALSNDQHKAMIAQFNQFFELSPLEKQKALGGLSDIERAQMQNTLNTFEKLPPLQRIECIRAFGKFANMSPQERAEFLKNAQRWSQMTPADRKAWSDLVSRVPQWKPLPPAAIMPPVPPSVPMPKSFHPLVVTNGG